MVVRRTEVGSANWKLQRGFAGLAYDAKITGPVMREALKKTEKELGKPAAKVLNLAYEQSKAKAGGAPTRQQLVAELTKATGSLSNERAAGRVNDGYVDAREASLVKGDLAKALYTYLDTSGLFGKPTDPKDLKVSANQQQINKAVRALGPVIDAGFKLYKADPDKYEEGPANALRDAAKAAGLSAQGRAAMLTALNGASTRSDGGDDPTAADVKKLLTNAQSKLKLADGAAIVDLARPEKAATKKKDGITTGLELDRTPAATGMTSRALLAYAATL